MVVMTEREARICPECGRRLMLVSPQCPDCRRLRGSSRRRYAATVVMAIAIAGLAGIVTMLIF